MTNENAYVELSFSPNAALVPTVRRFVGEFYGKVLLDDSVASRLVVATHELLENAVRYSADGQSAIRIAVQRETASDTVVTIDTQNRTLAEHRKELAGLVDEMRAHPSRAEFYQTLLRRSAKRKEGSGLGLGRIHAETDLDLSYRVDGETVHLHAEGRFSTGVRQ